MNSITGTRNRTEKDFALCIKCENRFAKKEMHRVGNRLTENRYICSTCREIYDNARSMQQVPKEVLGSKVWSSREQREKREQKRVAVSDMQTYFSED